MRIAICDDEKVICEQINELVKRENPGACPERYETGEALLASGKQFDLVFLDIQMEGIGGIETAREIRKREDDAILVFITGIREYVFQAFDVAAFHYLLKPIEEGKFHDVFQRAERELQKRQRRQEPILVKTRSRSYVLEKERILYVESRGKKVEIHMEGEVVEAYVSMNEMEGQLGAGFYRCHRGYLVNMAYVAEYDREGVTLNNGGRVYLAKEKYREFVKTYMRYLRKEAGKDG